jgi:3-isopropylmalate dehydrogenase
VGAGPAGDRFVSPHVVVIPGDGIGPEVIAEAVKVLPAHIELTYLDTGADRYLDTGTLLTDEEMGTIAVADAVLMGAVGDPRVPDGILERGILLRLRKALDLYVNLRPLPGLDLVFVRENTEGPYSGVGGRSGDIATEVSINTRAAVERCVRYAFELATTRSKRVTLAHKSNVLVHAGSLWREVTEEVASHFPEIALNYEHADAAAYHLVVDPARFDVIVTDNLFGDLLSDLAAGLDGGLGRAASANVHPDPATRRTRCLGLFEPVHGSAPDIVGTGSADPTAAIRAAQMMLDTLDKEASLA